MVAFYAPADVRRFADWIEAEAATGRRYVPRQPGLVRDLAEGLVIWLAFQRALVSSMRRVGCV